MARLEVNDMTQTFLTDMSAPFVRLGFGRIA
jgi:hypothetical protein